MKQHTEQEIKDFMDAHYEAEKRYVYELKVDLVVDTPERIVFKAHCMYEAPPFNTALLFALCEFFDTKHINDVHRWSNGGCETCAWGSDYGFELEVLP